MSAHTSEEGKSDLKVGLTGLGIGIGWIFIVSAIAYSLANAILAAH
jgi:hypothetical protein